MMCLVNERALKTPSPSHNRPASPSLPEILAEQFSSEAPSSGWFRHLPIVQDRYHCLGGRARMASSTIWASHRLRVHLLQLLNFNWVDVTNVPIRRVLRESGVVRRPATLIQHLSPQPGRGLFHQEWSLLLHRLPAQHLQMHRDILPKMHHLPIGNKFRCLVNERALKTSSPSHTRPASPSLPEILAGQFSPEAPSSGCAPDSSMERGVLVRLVQALANCAGIADRYHYLSGMARMASSTIWASHRLRVHLLQLLHFRSTGSSHDQGQLGGRD
ncbi:unnamed protein product [Darwinula stevensoni]|uniref:Uncharacterized protein n=1 Tax=Darwinula stevensoni TaxID=69355 RepID=A0A7R9AAM3_9CRUS|nr:unnamed protein product [Darwinula stevensoni]CAG0898562.1 unnamed protein product [Darwinula stevensoni]